MSAHVAYALCRDASSWPRSTSSWEIDAGVWIGTAHGHVGKGGQIRRPVSGQIEGRGTAQGGSGGSALMVREIRHADGSDQRNGELSPTT